MSSSKKQTEQQTSQTNNPWAPQIPYLTKAFSEADTAYGTAKGATSPDNFVAQFTPEQLSVFQRMINYGGNPSTASAAGDTLNAAGAGGTAGALSDLGAFRPTGGTQANIDAATQYANNPAISGMVDAALRDSKRQLTEQQLPQVARNAALTGNIDSNRRQISEGILTRGFNDKAADVSANLRGNAYQEGLKLAEANNTASMDAILKAAMARGSIGNDAIGAAGNAVAQQSGLFDIAGKGVAGQNLGAQAELDNAIQRYGFETDSPFAALNNYFKIIGANNWGGTSTGTGSKTETSTPSTLDTIGKLMGSAGSLASFFSDRRIKTDIVQIGTLYDGLPVYRFRYKDVPELLQIGLMAQDVEKKYPEAVGEVRGVKTVNYDLATRGAVPH